MIIVDNSEKIIVHLCAGTGKMSVNYQINGYTVYKITSPEYDVNNYYIYGNYLYFRRILEIRETHIAIFIPSIYGIFAEPSCTQFSFAKTRGKPRDLKKGLMTVNSCIEIVQKVLLAAYDYGNINSIKFWLLENPKKGYLYRFLGRPGYQFQPCDFGDPYTKPTYLWGVFNHPKKNPVEPIKGSFHHGIGYQELPEGYKRPPDMLNNRACRRAITPPGFAKAFYEANK